MVKFYLFEHAALDQHVAAYMFDHAALGNMWYIHRHRQCCIISHAWSVLENVRMSAQFHTGKAS